MKQLMIIPLSFMGLLSLGHSTVPILPVNPSWSVIGDTTIPLNHRNHAMKGNGTDTTGNSQGKWQGKHHSKGAHNDGTGTSTNATGTANPATGTGAGASTGTGTNK